MAKIVRGERRDEQVRIHQIANDWAYVANGTKPIKLGMLELSPVERVRHHDELYGGDTFRTYDEEHFKATGRFKRIQWAKI